MSKKQTTKKNNTVKLKEKTSIARLFVAEWAKGINDNYGQSIVYVFGALLKSGDQELIKVANELWEGCQSSMQDYDKLEDLCGCGFVWETAAIGLANGLTKAG